MEGDASAAEETKEERTKRKRRVARGNAISSEKVVESEEDRRLYRGIGRRKAKEQEKESFVTGKNYRL